MVCNTSTHRFKSGLRLWKALDESGAFLLQKIREYKEAGNDEIHVICYFLLFVFTGVIEQEAVFLLVSESILQNSRLHGWCGSPPETRFLLVNSLLLSWI